MTLFSIENATKNSDEIHSPVIILEGNISSGKTTLGNRLVEYLNYNGYNARFFEEYRNDELLNQYIYDMKRYAFPFQLFMLRKRIQIYKEAYNFSDNGGISIIDRSIFGDYAFCKCQLKSGNITIEEFHEYESILKSEALIRPHLIVYLDCDTSTCSERIKKRGIKSEIDGYDEKYLHNIEENYKDVITEHIIPFHKFIIIDNRKENKVENIVEIIKSSLYTN